MSQGHFHLVTCYSILTVSMHTQVLASLFFPFAAQDLWLVDPGLILNLNRPGVPKHFPQFNRHHDFSAEHVTFSEAQAL